MFGKNKRKACKKLLAIKVMGLIFVVYIPQFAWLLNGIWG